MIGDEVVIKTKNEILPAEERQKIQQKAIEDYNYSKEEKRLRRLQQLRQISIKARETAKVNRSIYFKNMLANLKKARIKKASAIKNIPSKRIIMHQKIIPRKLIYAPRYISTTEKEINSAFNADIGTGENMMGNENHFGSEGFYGENFFGSEFDTDPVAGLGINFNKKGSPLFF